jgi:hypothetical protein
MEQKYADASAVRVENEILREQMAGQQQNFRERGKYLKEEGRQTYERAQQAAADAKASNGVKAAKIRSDREALRERRQEQQRAHEERGRQILEAQREQLVRMRAVEEGEARRRREKAAAEYAALKQRTQAKRVEMDEEDVRRAQSVRGQTSRADLVRPVKQMYANTRWAAASAVRQELAEWKQRRYQNDVEYLAKALEFKLQAKTNGAAARAQKVAELEERASEARAYKRQLKVQGETVKKAVYDCNRAECTALRMQKQVPVEQERARLGIASEGEGIDEEAMAKLGRFFGFRQRGAGSRMSSVVSV